MVANLDKPAFKAYCIWRAYGEAGGRSLYIRVIWCDCINRRFGLPLMDSYTHSESPQVDEVKNFLNKGYN